MNSKEGLKRAILDNDFSKFESLIKDISKDTLRDVFMEISFDTVSLLSYSIVCMLLIKNETADLHYLASEILFMPLCHLKGAYEAALYHTRKAIILNPDDITLKEFLLLFYEIPERLISKKEAKDVANEILK